jgi:hypothetical protein
MNEPIENIPSLPARPTLRLKPSGRIFICWRVGGSRPKVRHTSLAEALAERERVQKLHPDSIVECFELISVRRGIQR